MLSLPYDLAASCYRRYAHPADAGQYPAPVCAAGRAGPPITLEPPSTASYQREERLSLVIPLVIPLGNDGHPGGGCRWYRLGIVSATTPRLRPTLGLPLVPAGAPGPSQPTPPHRMRRWWAASPVPTRRRTGSGRGWAGSAASDQHQQPAHGQQPTGRPGRQAGTGTGVGQRGVTSAMGRGRGVGVSGQYQGVTVRLIEVGQQRGMLGQIHVVLAGEAARAVGGDPGLGDYGLAALDVGDGQGEGRVRFQAVAGDIDVVADRALHLQHLGPGGRDGPQQQERGEDQRPDEPHRTSKAAWRGVGSAGRCGSASGTGEQARRTLARTEIAGKYGQLGIAPLLRHGDDLFQFLDDALGHRGLHVSRRLHLDEHSGREPSTYLAMWSSTTAS